MTLELRLLSGRNVASLRSLQLDPEQERFAGGGMSTLLAALPAQSCSNAVHPFSILADGEPIGFFILRETKALPVWAPAGSITLHHFRIDRFRQGRGYGRRGIGLAAHWILVKRPGIENLLLSVNSKNLQAQSLYRKCGFIDTGAIHPGALGNQNVLAGNVRNLVISGGGP